MIIHRQEAQSGHAYHVLGGQGLYWSGTNNFDKRSRKEFLEYLSETIKEGVKKHPRQRAFNIIKWKDTSNSFATSCYLNCPGFAGDSIS